MDGVEATKELQNKITEHVVFALFESGPARPLSFGELEHKTEASRGSLAVVLTEMRRPPLPLAEVVWEGGERKLGLTQEGTLLARDLLNSKKVRRELMAVLTHQPKLKA